MQVPEWFFWFEKLDRNPNLTRSEKQFLGNWIDQAFPRVARQYSQDRQQELQGVQRFTQPIEEVFDYCGYHYYNKGYIHTCCILLLKEMHERQTALWAWDEAAWLEIVGRTTQDFRDRHSKVQLEGLHIPVAIRSFTINCAYLLGGINIHNSIVKCDFANSAQRIFGWEAVANATDAVRKEMEKIGLSSYLNVSGLSNCICLALLLNRKPELENLTLSVLEQVSTRPEPYKSLKQACVTISHVLHSLGIIQEVLASEEGFAPPKLKQAKPPIRKKRANPSLTTWENLIKLWGADTRAKKRTITSYSPRITKIARWVIATYPTQSLPHQWTTDMAWQLVKAVEKMRVGQWNHPAYKWAKIRAGKELQPNVKAQILAALRRFFTDGQAKGLFTLSFDPSTDLRTPSDIIAQIKPDPKAIEKWVWEKLEEAGLSLTEEDLLSLREEEKITKHEASYPLEMVQAMALVLLFGGLRSDEIVRLQRGCIQPQPYQCDDSETLKRLLANVCILRVPPNKSCGEFEKAVDYRLGEAVSLLENRLPKGPRRWDETSKGTVHYLFEWQGRNVHKAYINQVLIPFLCRKAQVGDCDAKGRIRCHRARVTLATRYYKAGLTKEELQRWLGHGKTVSIGHYLDLDDDWQVLLGVEIGIANRQRRFHEAEPSILVNTLGTSNLSCVDQELEDVEQEENLTPGNYLAHLYPQPKRPSQVLIQTAQDGLSAVLRNVYMTLTERQEVGALMKTLDQIATRS